MSDEFSRAATSYLATSHTSRLTCQQISLDEFQRMLNPDTVLAEGDGLELGISGEAMKLSPPNDPDGLDVDAPDVS